MTIKTISEEGYCLLRVTGFHDFSAAGDICREVIRLLIDRETKILIDTTGITGYVPALLLTGIDLDCFPLSLKSESVRVLFLETSNQVGKHLFGENDYNKNGIQTMITVNKPEGLKWLLE